MRQQAIPARGFAPRPAVATAFTVLVAISYCHFSNDLLQSLLPAIYPNLSLAMRLNLAQIGFVTLAYQITASLLQPLVGLFADKRPTPIRTTKRRKRCSLKAFENFKIVAIYFHFKSYSGEQQPSPLDWNDSPKLLRSCASSPNPSSASPP